MDKDIKRSIILDNYQNSNMKHTSDDSYVKINTRNVSCIDNLDIYLKIRNNIIIDASFEGEACVISISSTNILINMLIGKTCKEGINIINNYLKMINEEEYDKDLLGDLLVFDDTSKQPSRIKCATLSANGIKEYLVKKNFDDTVNETTITESINVIEEEINKQNGKHEAVTHYIDEYGFVPPFVLTKILTLGELSRLYAMLKQSDRQSISKNFKLSDKVLKQIIVNMTMIRNICAHNDRLFSFHSKFRISFKYIQENYNEKSVNIYMVIKCMESLLPKEKKKEFVKLINNEIKILDSQLKSIKIDNILNIMGFYKNK